MWEPRTVTQGHRAHEGPAGDPVASGWSVSVGKNSGCLGPKTQHEVAKETRIRVLTGGSVS